MPIKRYIYWSKTPDIRNQKGQSILEVIIAVAIFSLIGAAMTAMVVGGFNGLMQGGDQTQAGALAQEGIEAVRSIRDGAWNELVYKKSAVAVSSSQWIFTGEGMDESIGKYTRTIIMDDVCRDETDEITDCPGAYTDVHSKQCAVNIDWETRPGIINSVRNITYLTNWDSRDWMQSDWSGGDGQSIWSNATMYDSDDGNVITNAIGQVTLASAGTAIKDAGFNYSTDSSYDWPFIVADNYINDADKIEVIGGAAQLAVLEGDIIFGTTINTEFNSDANGWQFNMWDAGGGEVDPIGVWQSPGGNPGGYIDITIPYNAKDDELGGYWEQPINITEDNAAVTCYFDWSIIDWEAVGGVDSYHIYVFLDDFSGAPVIGNQCWLSESQSGITDWSGQQSIDCSLAASASGTYYYKLAVWLDTRQKQNTGPITAAFDNAKIYWQKTSGGSYSTDKPDIYPTASFSVSGVQSWDSFTATTVKNGGEIYYQLSDNNGSAWQYWDGLDWVIAVGATDHNTATVINTNISNFSVVNEQIKFKAFLESDGSQLVQLNNINIGFTTPAPVWSFAAWDVGSGEVTPTGIRQPTGGNSGGYVNITVPQGNNNEVGGYWLQSFVSYIDNPSVVVLDFDYKVIDFNGAPNVAEIRVYIDSFDGDPINQVGGSISISNEGVWISADQYDVASAIATSGVYYFKIAFWVETLVGSPGPYTVGFDNVKIDLGDGSYPISGSLISSAFDMTDASPAQIIEWGETALGDSNVRFQIRTAPDAGGSPGVWTEWYGANGSNTYFTTSTGSLIPTDLNDKQWMQYSVELTREGGNIPVLENIKINYK